MQTISTFPRAFSPGDSPNAVAILYTDEQAVTGAVAVADLFRLEIAEAVAVDLPAEAAEVGAGALQLVCRIPAEVSSSISAGVYFLRFRVIFADASVLTIPPDSRLRLRVT